MMKRTWILIFVALIPSAVVAGGINSSNKRNEAETAKTQPPGLTEIKVEDERQKIRLTALEGAIDPETYILGPFDRLLLMIGGPENSFELDVLPEGSVVLPNVGSFKAAGLTLSEFQDRLRKALRRYYKNIDIDCRLVQPRAFVVFVLGEVEKPGPVVVYAPFRVSRALDEAGGVTGRGSMREIEIREDNQLVRKVDLFSFLNLGDFDQNPMLKEGQSVLIPVRRNVIGVVGEVRKPGSYELVLGETVEDLLAYCGGITAFGDKGGLILERFYKEDSVSTKTFHLDDACDIVLQDRDVIVVPDILSFPQSRFVHVVGSGGREGRFFIHEGEKLRDFLPRIWRLSPDHLIDEAVLERKTSETFEHIRFSPAEVVAGGPQGDIELRSGDVITLPPFAAKVYVTGEVVEPGGYPFRADFRAEEYISLAGGPTKSGGYGRMSIYSRDGTKREANKASVIYRGETILVKRKRSASLGSFIAGLGSLSAFVLAIVALTR
ncbi:MAG: hypothetical protein GTO51_04665 [Candidatus Latescibacteria bacterium]|nr:hypothetical protein [Candidatus Latescibacterota bacterium]NIM21134.1 hypothetical protein [Candidatus Latescibacterota bacterium]NIM65269.1 hypothetical protein [Candidatus Latescibacterota bacterium]NIO01784.1 hypothetical protein [Candidatus Latescibacterota bacterium]NIO28301.1 hypothetical protein [Candidatus Latescibacterota bacterium]